MISTFEDIKDIARVENLQNTFCSSRYYIRTFVLFY